ncbi:MAG: hypothetical protein M3P53_05275 [Actinomycetota bacterium]|nr:hypothetical protein [Actinomycetota bacterium]
MLIYVARHHQTPHVDTGGGGIIGLGVIGVSVLGSILFVLRALHSRRSH